MDRIEYLADSTVRRGCGFMLLAVLTVMWGLSYDLLLCLKTGAILMTLHCAALGVFAYNALRKTYLRYAELSGMMALGLAIGAAVVWIVRGQVWGGW